MLHFNRTSDNLIVAGNGPSLKNTDLNSMPKEYDVFRCNQFYCEDKYYLGKNIKLVMFNPMVIYSQLKTLNALISKQEYHVEYVCLNYINKNWDINFNINDFIQTMPFVMILNNFINNTILKELCLLNEFNNLRPTSGVLLMLLGKSLGYKNIYYTGIDFANNKNISHINYNKDSIIHNFIYKDMLFSSNHTPNTDLLFIKNNNFLQLNTLENTIQNHVVKNNYINDIIKDTRDNIFIQTPEIQITKKSILAKILDKFK